jgi:hypothetical protein
MAEARRQPRTASEVEHPVALVNLSGPRPRGRERAARPAAAAGHLS